ncbi:uncharacterized protein LOC135805972 [Sycon ciliatum]|uniref:uncharacterized protein LOC135805972 n=1 Tax=Sycon ciliatum TaxID=27933 RepID=UPI0031F6ABE3
MNSVLQILHVAALIVGFTNRPISAENDQTGGADNVHLPKTQHDFHAHAKDDLKHQQHHLRDVVGLSAAGRKHFEKEYGGDAVSGFSGNEGTMLHFFVRHDYDKSNTLDGIELSAALTSYYDFGMPEAPQQGAATEQMSHEEKTSPLLLQEEVEAIVDRILNDHDLDRNGLLTFAELLANPGGIWSSLDMVDDLDDYAYDGEEEGDGTDYQHDSMDKDAAATHTPDLNAVG